MAGLISGVIVGAATPQRSSHALPSAIIPEPKTIFADAKPGEEVWFSWSGPFRPTTEDRVFTVATELLSVQPGLEVVKLIGANRKLGAGVPPRIFVGPLLDDEKYPKQALLPVSIVRFEPGKSEQDWYFLAAVKATKPGTYHVGGWRLRYSSAGLEGVTTYEQRLEIRVK